MNFELIPLRSQNIEKFKKDMQEAFQQGAVDEFGEMQETILPESHIDRSMNTAGAVALEAVVDGEMVGGAIVVINEKTNHNHLDFLYVKNGVHDKGIGQAIWASIEKMFPETKIWETCTPYFEKRNIHFYVNRCKFHIVEFYNEYHKDPHDIDTVSENDYFEGMFRFEKEMNI